MKISEALRAARARGLGENAARTLMRFHSNLNNEEIFLLGRDELAREDDFFALVTRFEGGEPLEYITGVCEFLGREFAVGEGVLVPRDETEILVEKTLEVAAKFEAPRICEIGTGSGIIAVSLSLALPCAKIVATDISQTALGWARKNAFKFECKNVDFVHSNLMNEVRGEFDIIVSNPPYIARDYPLDKWVRREPESALFGGERGDELLQKIIALAAARGAKYLLCEMGYDQKTYLAPVLAARGFETEFYVDLAGFDRGFVARNSNLK